LEEIFRAERINGLRKAAVIAALLLIYLSYSIYPFTALDFYNADPDEFSSIGLQSGVRIVSDFQFLTEGRLVRIFQTIPRVTADRPPFAGDGQLFVTFAAALNILLAFLILGWMLRIVWLIGAELFYLSGYQGMLGARVLYPKDAPNQPDPWQGYSDRD
jgi:hypothetical protein